MKPSTATYIKDIVWDIRIANPLGDEIKRQVIDIFEGVAEPVFSSTDNGQPTVVVGSPHINTRGLGPDDHIVRSDGSRVDIAGGSDKAAAYGVFSFLEEIGFYFLASRFVKPSEGGLACISSIDRTYRTKNSWRGMFLSFCMVSTSIMSLKDYEILFDNMGNSLYNTF